MDISRWRHVILAIGIATVLVAWMGLTALADCITHDCDNLDAPTDEYHCPPGGCLAIEYSDGWESCNDLGAWYDYDECVTVYAKQDAANWEYTRKTVRGTNNSIYKWACSSTVAHDLQVDLDLAGKIALEAQQENNWSCSVSSQNECVCRPVYDAPANIGGKPQCCGGQEYSPCP